MTKSELAAQKCADLANEGADAITKRISVWNALDFLDGHSLGADSEAFRRFVEHVSDLCKQAIASGDTSGLEELVLREPVDPDLLEARVIVANAAVLRTDNQRQAILDGHAGLLQVNAALAGLRRGREIERGEGM